MSVIAKLMVRGVVPFGAGGKLIELSCVCDNDLMAAYATTEEDKLFTKYSPWGEMRLHQPDGWSLAPHSYDPSDGMTVPPAFYVMAINESEHDLVEEAGHAFEPSANFPGASVWAMGVCYSVTDFGGTKQVQFQANNGGSVKGRAFEKLNWRMSVDNPAASGQFKPGERYFIVLYPAERFSRDQAIRAAHTGEQPS